MNKSGKRGSLAMSQIVILVIGIVAIAYVAGSSLGEVSAALTSANCGSVPVDTAIDNTFCYGSPSYLYTLSGSTIQTTKPDESGTMKVFTYFYNNSKQEWEYYTSDGHVPDTSVPPTGYVTSATDNMAEWNSLVSQVQIYESTSNTADNCGGYSNYASCTVALGTGSQACNSCPTPSAPAPTVPSEKGPQGGSQTTFTKVLSEVTGTVSTAKTAMDIGKSIKNFVKGATTTTKAAATTTKAAATTTKAATPSGFNYGEGDKYSLPSNVVPKPVLSALKYIGASAIEVVAYAGAAIGTYAFLDWAVNKIPGIEGHPVGEAWLKLLSAGTAGVAGGALAFAGGVVAKKLGLGLGILTGASFWETVGIGAAIAVAVWAFMYKQYTQKAVVFTCIPWEAPTGSSSCGECGADGLPCTAYECASLGQNCQILNSGVTGKQVCVATNKDDTVPPVMNFTDMEQNVYSFAPLSASAPSTKTNGVLVTYLSSGSGGELPPYTDFQFGIQTNKVAMCGISPTMIPIKDSSGGDTFNQLIPMDAGIFEYNHTFTFNSGNTTQLPTQDGKMNLYVRCEDANGNIDQSYFVIQFGVSTTELHTLPVIKATDIANNSAITSGVKSMNVTLYLNKPVSGCKWSPTDRTYQNMENTADCSQGNVTILNGLYAGDYQCFATLNGITDNNSAGSNNFYFRCNDTLGDVNNANAYMLHLQGTQPLVIQSVSPNDTVIEGTSNSVPVTLSVQTFAGANGDGSAMCYYNNTVGNDKYVQFTNSGTYQSTQQLSLQGGDGTALNYSFPVMCVDAADNAAYSVINFSVLTDTTPPSIVRVYKDGTNVAVVTDKNGTCVFDTHNCLYLFKDGSSMTDSGTLHETPWLTDRTYYIKCQDNLGVGPGPSDCTSIIQASSL